MLLVHPPARNCSEPLSLHQPGFRQGKYNAHQTEIPGVGWQVAREVVDTQTEHAYQKQPTSVQNKKRVSLLGETGKEKPLNTTRTSVWDSRCPRRLLRAPTLTRNAPYW
ncbi:40S ribosomal protein S11 [Manis javanica]|nr:40S ribosomal protein S11 [Manis javanica]